MASISFALLVLLILAVNIDGRRHSHRYQQRQIWKKIKDKTLNKFRIDFRHFDDEHMVLFPDIGFQTANKDGSWKLVIHGWRYESDKGRNWLGIGASEWVERIAKHMLSPDAIIALNGSLNRDRLKPFFYEDESNEWIHIKIGDRESDVQTNDNGEFYEEIEVPNDQIQKIKQQQQQTPGVITYTATGDNKDTAQGFIRLIEPRQGISVISDVDDTIKVSEVLDKVRLIANTFIHPFIPVTGKLNSVKEIIMSIFIRHAGIVSKLAFEKRKSFFSLFIRYARSIIYLNSRIYLRQ